MLENVRGVLTNWIVGLFVRTIKSIPRPEARIETLNWLSSSREIVASSRSARDKFLELYRSLNARRGVAVAFESVASAVKAYAKSDLPLAAKLALPATVLALPFAGGQAAGIAAFGSAIGVPVLLLIFIGAAGITAIIEACATNETARAYTMSLLDRVAQDERFRAFRAAMRTGSQGEPRAPNRATSPIDADREEWLRSMDPLEFQDHVMSFFLRIGSQIFFRAGGAPTVEWMDMRPTRMAWSSFSANVTVRATRSGARRSVSFGERCMRILQCGGCS